MKEDGMGSFRIPPVECSTHSTISSILVFVIKKSRTLKDGSKAHKRTNRTTERIPHSKAALDFVLSLLALGRSCRFIMLMVLFFVCFVALYGVLIYAEQKKVWGLWYCILYIRTIPGMYGGLLVEGHTIHNNVPSQAPSPTQNLSACVVGVSKFK